MQRNILIQGAARGIGLTFVEQLLAVRSNRVFATARRPGEANELNDLVAQYMQRLSLVTLDISDETSIRRARDQLGQQTERLDLMVTCAGILHDDNGLWPEKQLADVDPINLARSFAVNASGPLLMIKHFHDLLIHGDHAVIANLSARVGSIGDNRLGGWYAYRAAKAAQNQFTRTAAIELRRRSKSLICVGLHPGTVDTGLSAPFQKRVPRRQLQTPRQAVAHLLEVIDHLTPDDSGQVFDWAGERIAP